MRFSPALAALTAASFATTTGLAQAQAPTDPVSAYPAPGVIAASPGTQLSLRGVSADRLGAVTVVGSRSGAHPGELRAHSDGRGASFVPAKPFTAGEQVTVQTDLNIIGATAGDYTITIARPARKPSIRPQETPSTGNGATQSYATRRDLMPPAASVTTSKPEHSPGYVFLAPKAGRGQDGPMLLDTAGKLVWFKAMPRNQVATDFRAQTYDGKPVLTWWQGGMIVGDGRGQGVIYDASYRRVATVRAGNGYDMDLHEFTLTPQGTALLIVYNRVKHDLRSIGGSRDGVVVDGVVQEIDVKTGLVLFEWHSLGTVPVDQGRTPVSKRGELDYVHLNSVSLDGNGDFVVSARNSWTVYKIARATAQVAWQLGGEKPTLRMGPGTMTAWQHSARPQPDGTIMIYDNGASPTVHKTSRAITVRVDEAAKTATLVSAFVHPRKLLSATQGSVERLPSGGAFVGAGSQRWFSEYGPNGDLVLDGQLAKGNDSYRAFLLPWSGQPAQAPKAIATASKGKVTARASWNGATTVARWQLLAGADAGALQPVTDAPAAGFETAITAATPQPYVAMRALDAAGNALATSAAVKLGRAPATR